MPLRRGRTERIAAAGAIALLFWFLQRQTGAICCGDFDGYYHIKWARLIWDGLHGGQFPPAFIWLPLTTLDPAHYVDHHFLFHVVLIPFTWCGDLQTGAKIAAVIFATAAVWSCYWLIARHTVRDRWMWLVALLACSAPLLYRLNMTKAPPLAIILLAIGVHLLFERRHRLLVPLAFVFALTYDMFVLLIVAAAIWTAVIWWTERRFEWRPAAWVLLGALLGLVINPYFPRDLLLLWEHARAKLGGGASVSATGNEWLPYAIGEFVLNSYMALAAMVAGALAIDWRDRRRAGRPMFLLALAMVLMLMAMSWRRFAEYFLPFAIVFAAFSLDQYGRDRAIKTGLVWVVLVTSLAANVYRTARDIRASEPRDLYAGGAAWMRANIPAGQMVFNTDWDDFPRLFYYDPTHVYASGLDPAYLADRNPELSELYEQIASGQDENPGPAIRDRFGAAWVFTDTKDEHDAFYRNAVRSGRFDVPYEDRECRVLRLRR